MWKDVRKKSPSGWALTDLQVTSRIVSVQAYLEVRPMYGQLKIGLVLLSGKENSLEMKRGKWNYNSVLRCGTVSHSFPSFQDHKAESRTTDKLEDKVRGATCSLSRRTKLKATYAPAVLWGFSKYRALRVYGLSILLQELQCMQLPWPLLKS
jgi:hypothetical protein